MLQLKKLAILKVIQYNNLVTFNKVNFGCAKRGGSGALYLQSAVAGFNSRPEVYICGACRL